MKLNFLPNFQSQNIDLEKLRPNRSYDKLIANRNGAFTKILNDPVSLKKFLHHRPCPTCNKDNHTLVATKDNLDIVECVECQLVYVNPIFDEAKYQDLYKAEEYVEIVKALGEASHSYRVERFGVERASFIDKYHDAKLPKQYLDIGCSTGFTLEAIQKLGWSATGIELNPSATEFGKGRGLDINSISIEDYKPEMKFSAVSLFDVLEHLVEPKLMLEKVYDLLTEGGNLFIYVPNWNSASREILGVDGAHFVWPSHHLTYYTPETLKNFLEQNGFSVIHWETQGLDLFDVQWFFKQRLSVDSAFLEENADLLQFYVNASGHGKNLRMFAKKNGHL